jgi:predicted phage tail protein
VFIFFILLFLSKNVHTFILSSKQALNNKKSRKPRKNYKEFTKNENNKAAEEQQLQRKLPEPIIYQGENQRNILLADDNDCFKQHLEQTMREARAITNYFLELHKDMVNSYSSEYTNLLQNIFNSSWDDFTIPGRVTDHPFDIQNMYSIFSSNRDNSLKLIDNIMTKNIYTFIKSIEATQRFYKDVIESYLNCIKK